MSIVLYYFFHCSSTFDPHFSKFRLYIHPSFIISLEHPSPPGSSQSSFPSIGESKLGSDVFKYLGDLFFPLAHLGHSSFFHLIFGFMTY